MFIRNRHIPTGCPQLQDVAEVVGSDMQHVSDDSLPIDGLEG